MVLGALGALLDLEPDLEVVGRAADGVDALSEIERLAPDVVVTDLVMPDVDGIALLRRARELDSDLSVIVLTGQGTVESAIAAMRVSSRTTRCRFLPTDCAAPRSLRSPITTRQTSRPPPKSALPTFASKPCLRRARPISRARFSSGVDNTNSAYCPFGCCRTASP